jgi:hypothetical protein
MVTALEMHSNPKATAIEKEKKNSISLVYI